jgi:hypothetical protein
LLHVQQQQDLQQQQEQTDSWTGCGSLTVGELVAVYQWQLQLRCQQKWQLHDSSSMGSWRLRTRNSKREVAAAVTGAGFKQQVHGVSSCPAAGLEQWLGGCWTLAFSLTLLFASQCSSMDSWDVQASHSSSSSSSTAPAAGAWYGAARGLALLEGWAARQ